MPLARVAEVHRCVRRTVGLGAAPAVLAKPGKGARAALWRIWLDRKHSIVSRGAAENGLDTLTLECMYSRLSGGDAEPPHNSVSPGIRERNNAADLR
jgi:hypothetical protein